MHLSHYDFTMSAANCGTTVILVQMVRGGKLERAASRDREHGHGDDGLRQVFRQGGGHRRPACGDTQARRQHGHRCRRKSDGECLSEADHTDPAEDRAGVDLCRHHEPDTASSHRLRLDSCSRRTTPQRSQIYCQ